MYVHVWRRRQKRLTESVQFPQWHHKMNFSLESLCYTLTRQWLPVNFMGRRMKLHDKYITSKVLPQHTTDTRTHTHTHETQPLQVPLLDFGSNNSSTYTLLKHLSLCKCVYVWKYKLKMPMRVSGLQHTEATAPSSVKRCSVILKLFLCFALKLQTRKKLMCGQVALL